MLPYVKILLIGCYLWQRCVVNMTEVIWVFDNEEQGLSEGSNEGHTVKQLAYILTFFLFSTLTPTFQGTSALSDTVIINWKWYFQRNWQTWHFIIFVNTCHKWLLVRKFHFPLSISNQILFENFQPPPANLQLRQFCLNM